jgi:amidase
MLGVIGVAPENGEIFCGEPGPHGGNLDTLQITSESIVKLPVFHSGALLSIGDVHASMGEGEVCGTGIETRASVSIRVDVEKKKTNFPIIESKNALFVLSSDSDIEQAITNAVNNAVELIMEVKNISFTDAYMLTSIACDLMISQVVNPKKTAKIKIPKYLLNNI